MIFVGQSRDKKFKAFQGRRRSDEAGVVHGREGQHEQLAVHPVHHSAVTRDETFKVFLVVGPLDGAGEEATQWRDHGGEQAICKTVNLNGQHIEGEAGIRNRQRKSASEHGIRSAGERWWEGDQIQILGGACVPSTPG